MKKQLLYYSIILIGILFATSCCPDKKYYTIKDKEKLKFKQGDRFIYKSNLNNYDTLTLEEIIDESNFYESSEGFCATDFYIEEIYYYLNNKNNPYEKTIRPYLYLRYDMNNKEVYFTCYFNKPDTIKSHIFEVGDYYLGDKLYYNTFYAICYGNFDNQYVKKYVFNKETSIIFYEYPDGEQFSLLNNIASK